MKSGKERRQARREKNSERVMPTSKARANLAAALDRVYKRSVLVGFGRYGKVKAVLAPILLVRYAAGESVSAEQRQQVKDMASSFLAEPVAEPESAAEEHRVRKTKKKDRLKKSKATKVVVGKSNKHTAKTSRRKTRRGVGKGT